LEDVHKAIMMQQDAQRRRALAPEYDPVRQDFDLAVATRMEKQAVALLTPSVALQKGLGGEVVPRPEDDMPGLESVLKMPDLLNLGATEQRANLLGKTGVLELGIEAAHQANADNTIEKMAAHQMAAAHKRAMELLGESAAAKDPEIAIKKARASARLMDAFSRSALTLQRLQRSGDQIVQVQYIQVNNAVGGASGKMHKPVPTPSPSKRGRPSTTGYRTNAAIAQRVADRELLLGMKKSEDMI
jgi:hypothetical protein